MVDAIEGSCTASFPTEALHCCVEFNYLACAKQCGSVVASIYYCSLSYDISQNHYCYFQFDGSNEGLLTAMHWPTSW